MKRILALTAAALLTTITAAAAQEQSADWFKKGYMMTDSGKMMIMGPNNQRSEVLMGENGMAPSNCPEGSFYSTGESTIAPCGKNPGVTYKWRPAASGDMMASGEAYPSGAMILDTTGDSGSSRGNGTGGGKKK
jgi:hypothetical protein